MKKTANYLLPEYKIWSNMKDACYNPRARYAAHNKGVKVYGPWRRSFERFLADVGRRPRKGLQLRRLDPDGDFTPSNLKWMKPPTGITHVTPSRNTPEYVSYHCAKSRCINPNYAQYERYGGSGIKFLYKSFRQFLDDVGRRPLGYTLHRKARHYEPGKCVWAEGSEQRRSGTKSKSGYSKFKGVHRVGNRWHVMISAKNRTVRLGQFQLTDERKAAQVYDKAARRYHGKKAVTNAMLGRL